MAYYADIARPGEVSCMDTGEPELAEQSLSPPHTNPKASAAAGLLGASAELLLRLSELATPSELLSASENSLRAVWPPMQAAAAGCL